MSIDQILGDKREAVRQIAKRHGALDVKVFGSVARGEERSGSDVDLLLVGSVGFADAVKALHPVQARIRREINPVVMTAAEFRKKSGELFLREVLAGQKLFLIGDEDELGKLAGHPPPRKA